MDRRDRRVLELAGDLGFLQKSLPQVRAPGSFRTQNLERDLSLECPIVGAKHHPHAPPGELTKDFVAARRCA